ncbi:hypothetical protein JTE90_018266 [Oedothorax gibbosus]|uniref:Uncharacterized protein n=1 Tax=Oedothorax gibbosus TaxID=931172 RepID=A0AAV6UWZ6_9ARAC|nr:hypothetical protein JTE90_018266 [Oedothorax gibbosus]
MGAVVFVLLCAFCGVQGGLIDALGKGLDFMEANIGDINLDAVLGTRLVEEQLTSYFDLEADVMPHDIYNRIVALRDKARFISNEGMSQVAKNDPQYFQALGQVMAPSVRPVWYPSQRLSSEAVIVPLPCSRSAFNETDSDTCLQEIVGTERQKNTCMLSSRCVQKMTSPGQRDYMLTHQVLYWQLVEMRGCRESIPHRIRTNLCSNVMRDAKRIAEAQFPRNHRDLFMEQVGLCGMWGFRDFYKDQWVDTFLSWQQESGCYNDRAKWHCADNLTKDVQPRMKRREKIHKDGCLSHKTAVALLAMAVSIRFELEKAV